MATPRNVGKDPKGPWTLQVVATNGRRATIGLGRMSQKDAFAAASKIEELRTCCITGQMPRAEILEWLAKLPHLRHRALVRAGLVKPREQAAETPAPVVLTLGQHIADVLKREGIHVKPRTLELFRQTEARLLAFFGADKPLTEITPLDIQDWMDAVRHGSKELGWNEVAEGTSRLHGRNAKRFLNLAVKWERLNRSPFNDEIATAAVAASKKDVHVSDEIAERVLAKLPTTQDRLIFGLARYAGLRHPSETDALTRDRVDMAKGRLTVFAPKAHRRTKKGRKTEEEATRVVPIDPRLRPLLEAALAEGSEDDPRVVTRPLNNRHRTLLDAIEKAGAKRWPALFHSLRKSRGDEWERKHGVATAAALLGNTPEVAIRHYTGLVPDEVFQQEVAAPKAAQKLQTATDTAGHTHH